MGGANVNLEFVIRPQLRYLRVLESNKIPNSSRVTDYIACGLPSREPESRSVTPTEVERIKFLKNVFLEWGCDSWKLGRRHGQKASAIRVIREVRVTS